VSGERKQFSIGGRNVSVAIWRGCLSRGSGDHRSCPHGCRWPTPLLGIEIP